jgi:hypothetical protein
MRTRRLKDASSILRKGGDGGSNQVRTVAFAGRFERDCASSAPHARPSDPRTTARLTAAASWGPVDDHVREHHARPSGRPDPTAAPIRLATGCIRPKPSSEPFEAHRVTAAQVRPAEAGGGSLPLGSSTAAVRDITVFNSSAAWATGGLVSTAADMAHYWRALLGSAA